MNDASPRSIATSNKLLASLSATDLASLQPHLKAVELVQGNVLFETGAKVDRVYFPYSGVVSLVVELATGETIETAMVGRESIVGGLAAVDGQFSLSKAIVPLSVSRLERIGRQATADQARSTVPTPAARHWFHWEKAWRWDLAPR